MSDFVSVNTVNEYTRRDETIRWLLKVYVLRMNKYLILVENEKEMSWIHRGLSQYIIINQRPGVVVVVKKECMAKCRSLHIVEWLIIPCNNFPLLFMFGCFSFDYFRNYDICCLFRLLMFQFYVDFYFILVYQRVNTNG